MQSRKSLIVYFKSPKVLKKLKTFGNLTYYHKKRKYAVLYVDGDKVDHLIDEIKKLHHVRYAEVSRLDDDQFTLDDFSDLGKKEDEHPPLRTLMMKKQKCQVKKLDNPLLLC